MTDEKPFLTRVVLKNYKSIAASGVDLRPLTFLVGPNGSGKSNFLDALRFVTDSLRGSLDNALRDRGGIAEVRRRSGGHPTHFGIRLEFQLPAIGGPLCVPHWGAPKGRLRGSDRGVCDSRARRCPVPGECGNGSGNLNSPERRNRIVPPAAAKDRLYLVNVSGVPEVPAGLRRSVEHGVLQPEPGHDTRFPGPGSGELLVRDGSNLTSVLRLLAERDETRKKRIEEYLSSIVPGVSGVDVKDVPPKATLEFRQEVAGSSQSVAILRR